MFQSIKIFFLISISIIVMTPVYAEPTPVTLPNNVLNPTKIDSSVEDVPRIVDIVIRIVRWTYTIFFVIAVFMILMAAYTYLTAQAEPEKIKNATNQIVWASIAIAVALLAVSMSMIVKSIVSPSGGGTGGGTGSIKTTPTYERTFTREERNTVNLPGE